VILLTHKVGRVIVALVAGPDALSTISTTVTDCSPSATFVPCGWKDSGKSPRPRDLRQRVFINEDRETGAELARRKLQSAE
jgi:hypothetical protein